MYDKKLEKIREVCDTSGSRLSEAEKDLLLSIIGNPGRYNGFESPVYTFTDSGRDFRDTWTSETKEQYKILIDGNGLRILRRFFHSCDGYDNASHWDWQNAFIAGTAREILKCLSAMKGSL